MRVDIHSFAVTGRLVPAVLPCSPDSTGALPILRSICCNGAGSPTLATWDVRLLLMEIQERNATKLLP